MGRVLCLPRMLVPAVPEAEKIMFIGTAAMRLEPHETVCKNIGLETHSRFLVFPPNHVPVRTGPYHGLAIVQG